MDGRLSFESTVCCQLEFSATGRSLDQRRCTQSGVPECDRESSIIRRSWLTGGVFAHGGLLAHWGVENLAAVYCNIYKQKDNRLISGEERLLLLVL